MVDRGAMVEGARQRSALNAGLNQISPEHYLRLLIHRKWLIISSFLLVSITTALVTYRLPNIFTSETLILVDPQKVPDAYVKSTVTGDVRNRLSTLSQQILSATRLQKVIETFNLYAEEKKNVVREDIVSRMRADISVHVVSDFGASQDLQAFRITYSGKEPRLVAQVTNQLASLFIEENLKAREQQASGTTEFLQHELQESRKTLEAQEDKLRNFKLKHIGEMPEQQSATLQIAGQLQSQLQLEGDALGRAEQQKSYIQSMMTQSAPVVDLDPIEEAPRAANDKAPITPKPTGNNSKAKLAALLARYTEKHPDVVKLKKQMQEEEAKSPVSVAEVPPPSTATVAPAQPLRRVPPPQVSYNPVLQSQLKALDGEITKRKEEQQRLAKLVAGYRAKLEAIPVREQEITALVRDYEISKSHYSQLLEKQLSAETATQLEIRQKGEKFAILDPEQVSEKPTSPNRILLNTAGSLGGLGLGLVLALATELFGMSITSPQQMTAASGYRVLEVIPLIQTVADRVVWRKRLLLATVSGAITVGACGAFLVYHYRSQIF